MNRPNRPARAVSTGLFALVFACAALSSHGFGQELQKVRVGYSALSLSFLPHLFARDMGLFRRHGLDAQLIQIAGAVQVAALAAGEIDFGAAVSPALFAAVRGLPLRAVMVTVRTPPFYMLSDPAVKRIDDLAGKKVAVDTIGALQYIAARAMFKNKGVNPDRISYIQTGSVSNSVAALASGSVEAALLSTPHDIIMAQKGFSRLTSAAEAGVTFPPSGLSMHASRLQKPVAQTARVLEALLDAQTAVRNDGAAAARYIERGWKLSPRLAQETQRQIAGTLVENGRMTVEAIQRFLDAAHENGQIPQRAAAAGLVDYGPLDEVLKARAAR